MLGIKYGASDNCVVLIHKELLYFSALQVEIDFFRFPFISR